MTRPLMVLLVLGSFVLGACSGDDTEADGGAQLACAEFRTLTAEEADGGLTAAELDARLKTVASRSRASDDPTLRRFAAELSESATPTRAPSAGAVSSVRGRCEALGL
jgi:hypothetical protein